MALILREQTRTWCKVGVSEGPASGAGAWPLSAGAVAADPTQLTNTYTSVAMDLR